MDDETGFDPSPWRGMMAADTRYASRAAVPDTIAVVFDPRPQYSQNREDYS